MFSPSRAASLGRGWRIPGQSRESRRGTHANGGRREPFWGPVDSPERQGWAKLRGVLRGLLALLLVVAAASAPVSPALAAKKKSSPPSIAAAIVVDMNSGT